MRMGGVLEGTVNLGTPTGPDSCDLPTLEAGDKPLLKFHPHQQDPAPSLPDERTAVR